MLGNGDGTYGASTDYVTASDPRSVAIADVDGDGVFDIVTANYSSNTVSVLLGYGDGTVQPHKDYAVGGSPSKIILADVNGDGRKDIIVGIGGGTTINVLINKGNGTFKPFAAYTTGSNPYYIYVADVNGDNKPDIIVSNYYSNTISVLLGRGDGTFGAKTDFATGNSPDDVIVADFNRDGKPDIAVANNSSKSVSILLGLGNGSFQAKTDLPLRDAPVALAVADINGDGKLDLIVTVSSGSIPGLNILVGNGDGTFQSHQDYLIGGGGANNIAVADINGDGQPDIVTGDNSSNGISVLLHSAVVSSGSVSISGVLTLSDVNTQAAAQNITFQFRPVGGGVVITKTQYVLPNGVFNFFGIPKNTYTLWIKGDKYLASVVSVNASSVNVSGVTATLIGGDANNDNSVDSSDFGILIGVFNSSASIPGSGYDATADLMGMAS